MTEGYWYDLSSGNFTKRASPAVDPTVDFPNAMWSFRGRPTIFGEPICAGDAECDKKGILQYFYETGTSTEIPT